MENEKELPPPGEVVLLDDDAIWLRSVRRTLLDVGVPCVLCMDPREDIEGALAERAGAVVLTDLTLGGHPLGGLSVVDTARRYNLPAALVTGFPAARFDALRAVPLMPKIEVNRASLQGLLRRLARVAGAPTRAKPRPDRDG